MCFSRAGWDGTGRVLYVYLSLAFLLWLSGFTNTKGPLSVDGTVDGTPHL